MTFDRLLLLASAVAVAATPLSAQGTAARARVVGAWLLESIVDTLPNGALAYWMGRNPTGAIVYAASGHMSVQFMRDPRPRLPASTAASADAARLAGASPFRDLGVDVLRDLLEGYYAYTGRYQVTGAGDSVAHYVESSLRPDEVGVTYRRAIRIEGDRLFITLHAEEQGVARHRVLTWRRAP